MTDEPNPYAPTLALSGEAGSPRRTISAVVLLLLGTASLIVGVWAVAIFFYAMLTNRPNHTVAEMVACCILYLGTGTALVIAGRSFRQYRDGRGAVAIAAAVLIPVVLFSIFGFK